MRKTLIYTAFVAIAAGAIFSSCESNAKKVENKKENVVEAKEELKEAQRELNAEYPSFKTDAEVKIIANEKRIEELRVKLNKPGKAPFDELRKKRIDELEQQNASLRTKLDAYEKENSDWEAFKREFNHDMEALGKSFENLVKDNKD
jgi:hypothetical protein